MNPTSVTFTSNPALYDTKPPESLCFIKDYLSRFISFSQSCALQPPYPVAHGHYTIKEFRLPLCNTSLETADTFCTVLLLLRVSENSTYRKLIVWQG
jgi:hypothetical protein